MINLLSRLLAGTLVAAVAFPGLWLLVSLTAWLHRLIHSQPLYTTLPVGSLLGCAVAAGALVAIACEGHRPPPSSSL